MSTREPSGRLRLQKFLSDAGVASRRHAEEYIRAGRVLVNGGVVDELPAFVDPAVDKVVVDGAPVRAAGHLYFLVHKPKGVVCTTRDPAGRTRAVDLLPPLKQKLFPVGRLDEDSSGLLLMTNDGELAQRITHPRFGVPKVYRVECRGRVPADVAERLRKGVYLSEGRARAARVEVLKANNDRSILNVTLREGRNRQIRRMLARLGHAVRSLKRVQIGPLSLKGLPVGAARPLTVRELKALRAELPATKPAGARQKTRRAGLGGRKAVGDKTAPPAPRAGRAKATRRGQAPRAPSPRRRIVT